MLEILETPLTVLHVFCAVVLILIILNQPGKSGGLTAALGGAGTQQVFGGRGAGNFLSKGTWVLASTFFMTSILLAYLSSSTDDSIREKKPHKMHHAPAPKPAEAPAKK
jgi:preprotein translocase subunit SecG